jgi:predicted permease
VSYFGEIAGKLAFIFLLIAVGALAKKAGMLSDAGERDVGRLMVDLAWPALIFASINTSLTASDIVDNLALPFLAVGLHLAGFLIGWGISAAQGYREDRRNVFLFHATLNNFFIMPLPFAQFLLPKTGLALLTVANLGSTITLWVLGVALLAGRVDSRTTLRNIFSPAMVSTLAAVVFVLTGVNRLIPRLVLDVFSAVGQPTLLLGFLVAGAQISKLGLKAVKFDRWNLLVGLVRNILVPAAVFALCLPLKGILPREAVVITMLVAMAPASVNSIPLALRYGSSPTLAAEGVLFTHLLAAPTMVLFIYLIDRFLIS